MKKLLIVLSMLASASTYSFENQLDVNSYDKTYVLGEKIHVIESGILIDMEEVFILTPCLSSDESGVYFKEYKIVNKDEYYKCPACGRMSGTGTCINPSCPLFGKYQ